MIDTSLYHIYCGFQLRPTLIIFLDKNDIHADISKNPLPNPAPKRQTLNLGCSCISWQDS